MIHDIKESISYRHKLGGSPIDADESTLEKSHQIKSSPNGYKVEDEMFEFDDVFVTAVSETAWEFVRATRSTDLLMFITWLERGDNGRV